MRRIHDRQDAEAGALDDVIDDIIPIVEAELFGQVSEEKEANVFVGGCKEAKHLRAYATYQILARGVTFRDHMSTLLQPVRCLHVSRICIKCCSCLHGYLWQLSGCWNLVQARCHGW